LLNESVGESSALNSLLSLADGESLVAGPSSKVGKAMFSS
jgi:hypothetical protein